MEICEASLDTRHRRWKSSARRYICSCEWRPDTNELRIRKWKGDFLRLPLNILRVSEILLKPVRQPLLGVYHPTDPLLRYALPLRREILVDHQRKPLRLDVVRDFQSSATEAVGSEIAGAIGCQAPTRICRHLGMKKTTFTMVFGSLSPYQHFAKFLNFVTSLPKKQGVSNWLLASISFPMRLWGETVRYSGPHSLY